MAPQLLGLYCPSGSQRRDIFSLQLHNRFALQGLQRQTQPTHVSLLFSDPTASGLTDPPAALVQGVARAPDKVVTSIVGFEDKMRQVFQRQPASSMYSSNWLMRYLFDWYYMRLSIYITPRRILWWPEGNFEQPPLEVEVRDVG